MKVSFVVPDFLSGTSFLQQPLDFLYATTLMERENFFAEIIDCRVHHISFTHLTSLLSDSDLIVITTTPCDQVQNYFLDYRYSYAINTIKYVKENLPHIPLAVCGAHVSVRPDLVIKEAPADYYIKGEVIYTAVHLARALAGQTAIEEVPNIIRFQDQTLMENRDDPGMYHPVLADDILPDYSKVFMRSYYGVTYVNNIPLRRLNRAVVQSGRGCPYTCSFCHNFYGRHIHRRSAEAVAEELFICQNHYGIEEIFFLDELFSLDPVWLAQLLEEIKKKSIHLEFTVQTRADHIHPDVLQIMAPMGVKNVWLGVESASDKVLEMSHKGIRLDVTLEAIRQIREAGMNPNAFFMLGMPGETVSTLNLTIRELYCNKLSYTRSLMICTPRYNTPMYDMAFQQYPFVQEHWFNLNAVKGLVHNEMTPAILQKAKTILKNRDFLFESKCPQL